VPEVKGEGWPSPDLPLTMGEAWKRALALYRKNFLTFFGIALIARLSGELLYFLLVSESQPLEVSLLALLPGIFITFLGSYALSKAILDRIQGRTASLQEAYGFVLSEIGPILGTLALILGLEVAIFVTAVGLTALIRFIGLLWLYAALFAFFLVLLFTAFIAFVFVEEGVYGWAGIRRSYELVRRDWGAVLVVLLLIVFPSLLLGLLFPESWIVAGIEALYDPLPFGVLAFLYLDIRRNIGMG